MNGLSKESHTDIQDQSFCGGFWRIDAMTSHPTYNGTDKVDVEDGIDINNVKHDCNAQKAHAPESRHVG